MAPTKKIGAMLSAVAALLFPVACGTAAGPRSTTRVVYQQLADLKGSDALVGDMFGESVAISGSTVVVGAPGYKSGAGRAYVFTGSRRRWHQSSELWGIDATANDAFGQSVAISGSTVVVGAPGQDHGAGRAYIFTRIGAGWPRAAEIEGSETPPNAGFGLSVGISGGTAVVGAPNARQVYIFTDNRTGWHQTAELKGSGTAAIFGASVAISGRTVLVGAPGYLLPPGAVYVFNRTATGWHKQAELEGSDHSPRFRPSRQTFGSSAAIWGDNVIIGAPSDSVAHSGAFVFTKGSPGWRQVAALEDLAGYGTELAEPVAVSGSTVLVGGLSSAYVFNRTETGWGRIAELRPSHVLANVDFGFAVALSGRTVIVGTGNDPSGDRVYVFGG